MKELPHLYSVKVEGSPEGNLKAGNDHLPDLLAAPPAEFDGPGDQWSPEELLMAAVANCLVLSFRAIATASKLEWQSIECESSGELDRVERKMLFTKVMTRVTLRIESAEQKEKAEKLLHKAEDICFITNSLTAEAGLECEIVSNSA
jgi:peroxiredoxin-like protein